ncbi:hypothetical protein AKO1_005888 [Acrasis kona]|uniref:Uncharacterized protein n=1 Tax=Acrasis kona TaxID=1008807 RepID=A0AAW2YK03_9EUKA
MSTQSNRRFPREEDAFDSDQDEIEQPKFGNKQPIDTSLDAPWTEEEQEKLYKIADKYPYQWRTISNAVVTKTSRQCRRKWYGDLVLKNPDYFWTDKEDEKLKMAVEKINITRAPKKSDWNEISKLLHPRTAFSCYGRWSLMTSPENIDKYIEANAQREAVRRYKQLVNQRRWKVSEIELLENAVASCAQVPKWEDIAKIVKTKSGEQCQRKWYAKKCRLAEQVEKDMKKRKLDEVDGAEKIQSYTKKKYRATKSDNVTPKSEEEKKPKEKKIKVPKEKKLTLEQKMNRLCPIRKRNFK